MQVQCLQIMSTLQEHYLQIRSTPQVPDQISVGAGWPCLWVLACRTIEKSLVWVLAFILGP